MVRAAVRVTRGEVRAQHLRALVAAAIRAGKVEVQRVDGIATRQSPLAPVLSEAGFGASPRGMVVWPRSA